MPSPLSASAESQLPGNRKDAKTVPKGKGKGRQTAAASRGASTSSSAAGKAPSASSARSADPWDSDAEELREDPLYAPPGKSVMAGDKRYEIGTAVSYK